MKKILAVVICCSFLCVTAFAQVQKSGKEVVVEKAVSFIKKDGYVLKDVNVVYDDGSKKWKERTVQLERDAKNKGTLPHGVLKNKEYHTVFFDFAESSPQADVWVFVDKINGKVLTVYKEKK
ncbi:MAG TPA: hypothetical protein PKY78_06615 [Candidatus Omnitrophota bacterium]|nr:hypothetical protein [Candidatus Omnitrophota bacterium]HPS20641.1 hypothetical protein [Candidatus Omnitrophota bacterium]